MNQVSSKRLQIILSRALSLGNLVLGYEYGRVFPASLGPDLPSGDGITWPSTLFSRSVDTRRRFGCVRMVSIYMVFARNASSEIQFGALREMVARKRLLLIHTFSVLSLQPKKPRRHNKSAITNLSNTNPACGHKEVPRSMGHIVVTTRYSDQQGSKSRQKVMRLYKQWHRPISIRFIKPPYSISRAASIDSDCCRLPTTSVLSNKAGKLRSNQF